MGKIRSLARRQAEHEQQVLMNTCLQALVRRVGRVRISVEELQALKAGDGVQLSVYPDGAVLLEWGHQGVPADAGGDDEAG